MLRWLVLVCCMCLPWLLPSGASARREAINAIAGDASWVERHAAEPTASSSAQERVRVHLAYAERLLRGADTRALRPAQRARRAALLDVLAGYRRAGRFPVNDQRTGAWPRFIDAHGTLCAVGRLVEASAGRALAEAIHAKHEWDDLLDMHEPALAEWAAQHGFTLRELALIQPSYPDTRPQLESPRPTGEQLIRTIEKYKGKLRPCVLPLLQKARAVSVEVQLHWPVSLVGPELTVKLAPRDKKAEACMERELARILPTGWGFESTPVVDASASVRFLRAAPAPVALSQLSERAGWHQMKDVLCPHEPVTCELLCARDVAQACWVAAALKYYSAGTAGGPPTAAQIEALALYERACDLGSDHACFARRSIADEAAASPRASSPPRRPRPGAGGGCDPNDPLCGL